MTAPTNKILNTTIFQCAAEGLTPKERLTKLTKLLSHLDTDLLVCPELYASGYDIGENLHKYAEPHNGPFAQQAASLAKQYQTAIIYGYPECDKDKLYNAALCIDKDGHQLANHRKLTAPPGFESEYFTPGDRLTLFKLNGLTCAILICFDAEFPETLRAAANAGAEIVIVPTALGRDWEIVAHKMIPTRALENGLWLLYANHAGNEGQSNYLGHSCIINPDGTDAARAANKEQTIHAMLDKNSVINARVNLPYLTNIKTLSLIS